MLKSISDCVTNSPARLPDTMAVDVFALSALELAALLSKITITVS